MNRYQQLQEELRAQPRTWLVTGCAGFIGSNLVETLLMLDQAVVGLDNFATGHRSNLDEVAALVGAESWARFKLIEGDIRDLAACQAAAAGVDYVLHQAALGSVPRSLIDPLTTSEVNVTGFLNMLTASRDAAVTSFVYAASSSTYGDHPALPKVEEHIGNPLSPYAVTKYVNELYAQVFARSYGFKSIGLRYFNVFGKRQDPDGAYAAVIPKWISAMVNDEEIFINGDGETSRDFCYVDNAVQANLLAAAADAGNKDEVYNVAVSGNTSLNTLYETLRTMLADVGVHYRKACGHREFRAGDVLHSQADIGKAAARLGYAPAFMVADGLAVALPWYVRRKAEKSAAGAAR